MAITDAEASSACLAINVDKNAAYPPAIEELKSEKLLEEKSELRQVKYLNNRIEQDHRSIKRTTNAGLGYQSFHTAWRTIRGIVHYAHDR